MRINPKEIKTHSIPPDFLETQLACTFKFKSTDSNFSNILQKLLSTNLVNAPFYTTKSFGAADMLLCLIEKMQKAHVQLSTFSLSTHQINMLHTLTEAEKILSLSLFLDWRVMLTRPDQVQHAKNIADNVHLTNIHAKLILLQNEHCKITIVYSANLNKNKRIEAGFLTNDIETFDFYADFLNTIANGTER